MLALLRWISRLPLGLLHAWGAALGWAAYAGSSSYRRLCRRHAALAGLTRAQQRAAVAQAGRLAAELPWLWLGPAARPIERWCRWEGDALIDQALQAGKGLVLLTPHMGSFEVCAQAYAERFGARRPMTALYRPARQPWLRELEKTARDRPGLATAPASLAGVRQMIRALRRGETIGLLPDQVPPEGMGVWAPFFGQPAYTMTLATRLLLQTGASLLLMWAERLPGARGWVLHVSEPAAALPREAASDEALMAACAAFVNAEMERLILQCPEQYLWGYNRYRRPRDTLPLAAGA
ncbi:lysophospholipid acyltransferase family protein [Aquincola sp. MAHUQ-54]|uniref:Lysophospholipid acyltransferase family protein n=1 Tax=Aquincola agrisoli TaxID=3119538 RepID=A0AAW9QNR7_9BURK